MTEPFYFKRYDMVIGKAENLDEMKRELERLRVEDPSAVLYHIKEGHISMWLAATGKKELADAIKPSMSIEETIRVLSRPSKTPKAGQNSGKSSGRKAGPRNTSQKRM
ncbi:MAG: hypothetical protein M1327_05775 [Candidatus Thermoplasmatota archaeon]|nr:hypothetical protein [Candidatus Thermoplasmatota archaeon]